MKSLRSGKAAIAESYADARRGEIWLINSNITEYLQAGRFNHAPKRPRKLLLHKRQINKLIGAVERDGMTLVPLKLYFNDKGRAKVELALAKGKKLHDKRETEKKRDWDREKGRLLRAEGLNAFCSVSFREPVLHFTTAHSRSRDAARGDRGAGSCNLGAKPRISPA